MKEGIKKLLTLSRRKFLWLVGVSISGVGLGWVYMRYLEPDWFEVTHKTLPSAPEGDRRIRILHLSDFHASDEVPFEMIDDAIGLGLEEEPDLICLTGDFMSWALPDAGRYRESLSRLSERAPVYACLGNHDGGDWSKPRGGPKDASHIASILEEAGIKVLHNRSEELSLKGRRLNLVGVGDVWNHDVDVLAFFDVRYENASLTLLLSHNPDSRRRVEEADWDLMLCGHTHGGQLIVPVIGTRPFVPISDPAFSEGLIPWKGRHIHVTRGVGNVHGMRFNCRPEVSLLGV